MHTIVQVIGPIIVLIALGQLLRRAGWFGDNVWRSVESLVYFLLFPSLLFVTLATRPVDLATGGLLILTGAVFLLSGVVLGLLARHLLHPDPRALASVYQCGIRFNAYIGMAVMAGLHGPEGISAFALLAGFAIPMVNIASVWALARHGQHRFWRSIATNPFIIATLLGLGWASTGLALPEVARISLDFLGQPALPLGLLATGAALVWVLERRQALLISYFLTLKLVLLPLIALGTGLYFNLDSAHLAAAVVLAALPPAASAQILAARMGGDAQIVAVTTGIGTVLAIITLPFWIQFL
jgi:malonate transporter